MKTFKKTGGSHPANDSDSDTLNQSVLNQKDSRCIFPTTTEQPLNDNKTTISSEAKQGFIISNSRILSAFQCNSKHFPEVRRKSSTGHTGECRQRHKPKPHLDPDFNLAHQAINRILDKTPTDQRIHKSRSLWLSWLNATLLQEVQS